jgi:AcrR family transcriptional regulator
MTANVSPRPYRQTARARGAEDTRRRIVEAFFECAHDHWFDDITLAEVATRAGTTVRTIIRQFGGKDGLVAGVPEYITPGVSARRTVAAGDLDAALDRLLENYERYGDFTIRLLAQELRHPVLSTALDAGRVGHRAVAAANFAPWLLQLDEPERTRALDALVISTDVYAWKLSRRDMGRSVEEARATLRALVEAVLASFAPQARRP